MKIILFVALALMLTGCFTTGRHATQPLVAKSESISAPAKNEVRLVLEEKYEVWAGTPYRFGGVDKSGIDCSAFVQTIFTDAFDVQLPRTTSDQVSLGIPVQRYALEPLDLVFFKTGGSNQHVGIYLGDGEFLHASTSRGVIISKLDNPYWKRHYWTARRPLDTVQLTSL